MRNIEDFYIRGKPIETPIGECYFIKMDEFDEINKYQTLLYLTKEEIYSVIDDVLSFNKEKIYSCINQKYLEEIKKMPYIILIKNLPQLGIHDLYKSIYKFFLKSDIFETFTTDEELLIYKIKIMGELENNFLDDEDNEEEEENLESNEKECNDDNPEKIQLLDIIKEIPELSYYKLYNELFNLCFKKEENCFNKIKTDEEFEIYKKLITDMNCINYEKENPNPEIQKFNNYDKILSESKGEKITYKSIYTSLWLELKQQPENLTIYQFYNLFNRLSQNKKFETSLIGLPYGGNLELWYKDLDNKNESKKQLENMSDEELESIEKVITDI